MSSKEIFVDSKGKFAQSIHGFVGVFTEKTALTLGKGHIQNSVHRFDLPMLPSQFH